MGSNDHIDQTEVDFKDFLEQLVEFNDLSDAALGITKQVIADGADSLSNKQEHVFKKYVLDEHTVPACSKCGSNVPWSDMYGARDNGGLCGYCAYRLEKIKEE